MLLGEFRVFFLLRARDAFRLVAVSLVALLSLIAILVAAWCLASR